MALPSNVEQFVKDYYYDNIITDPTLRNPETCELDTLRCSLQILEAVLNNVGVRFPYTIRGINVIGGLDMEALNKKGIHFGDDVDVILIPKDNGDA